jgi:hypothetical protein
MFVATTLAKLNLGTEKYFEKIKNRLFISIRKKLYSRIFSQTQNNGDEFENKRTLDF